jgi:hypothetical protein
MVLEPQHVDEKTASAREPMPDDGVRVALESVVDIANRAARANGDARPRATRRPASHSPRSISAATARE